MNLNMALPCRVSVYEQDGRTKIGMVRPTEMLALLSDDPRIAPVADEVETAIEAVIDEAAR
jgi:uncharacterized protein (DUF302 family)